VRGANTGEPPRYDLAALRHKLLQQAHVAVRNRVDFFRAEFADFLAAEEFASSAGSAAGASAGAGSRSAARAGSAGT
jgi:hypothetical protein